MWKFEASTDTLTTANSSTQTQGLSRVFQYLKSTDGVVRIVTTICRCKVVLELMLIYFMVLSI